MVRAGRLGATGRPVSGCSMIARDGATGPLDLLAVHAPRAASAEVVLLVGGADGGAAMSYATIVLGSPLLANKLRASRETPTRVRRSRNSLLRRDRTVGAYPNVLPHIGALDPMPTRTIIREGFVPHVIGGKAISRGPSFAGER